jgi:DNA polymerase I-like protein with 3'-5' exonuclease and polymerase domains
MVKREMEGACALDVPLVADAGSGANWRDAK